MNETVFLIIIIVILGGLIYLLVRLTQRLNKKKLAFYQTLSAELNMEHTVEKQFTTKLNTLTGQQNGRPVQITERIIGAGKHQTIQTFVEFKPSPFDFEFTISKEHFFSKIGRKMGLKDIEFDDFDLDRTFLLKSKDEEKFKALLDYRMQAALKEIDEPLKGTIRSTDKAFEYHLLSTAYDEDAANRLKSIMAFMQRLIESNPAAR